MRNFKWPSIYRVACPMYLWNLHFSIVSEARNARVTFVEKPQIKIFSFQNGKHGRMFNALLDQTNLWRVLLWIRIEVTLNLLIDSILIKLLCRFVNFGKMKKRNTKWFLRKIMKRFKRIASKIMNSRFFQQISSPPPACPLPRACAFLILMFFLSNLRSFHIHSFNNR